MLEAFCNNKRLVNLTINISLLFETKFSTVIQRSQYNISISLNLFSRKLPPDI